MYSTIKVRERHPRPHHEGALTFVIAIEIEEFDPVLTEIGDPYREASSKLKHQF